jgi:small basic protein (TIGR04137 family)
MSLHSSLRAGSKGRKHRSVLKRHERLRVLKDKSLWSESKSVLGILKVKMQKIKVKKEKAAAADSTAAAPAAAGTAAAPAKAAAPAAKAEKK